MSRWWTWLDERHVRHVARRWPKRKVRAEFRLYQAWKILGGERAQDAWLSLTQPTPKED